MGVSFVTNDVDLEDYGSELVKHIAGYRRHTSFGEADDELGLYFHDRKSFFHFDGLGIALYPDLEKTDKEVEAIYCSCLRSVYVIQMFRKSGIQQQILKEVVDASEATGEPFYAVASPFVIKRSRYETSGEDALYKFMSQGIENPKEYDALAKVQSKRFEAAGMFNITLPYYELTKPFQHWLYIPSNCSEKEKETGNSLRR